MYLIPLFFNLIFFEKGSKSIKTPTTLQEIPEYFTIKIGVIENESNIMS